MGDVEEKEQKLSKTLSTDPNDYTIIKEGDAEILMLANNEVFYNKTQVLLSLHILQFLLSLSLSHTHTHTHTHTHARTRTHTLLIEDTSNIAVLYFFYQ